MVSTKVPTESDRQPTVRLRTAADWYKLGCGAGQHGLRSARILLLQIVAREVE